MIQQSLSLEICPACHNNYNTTSTVPMLVCSQQHLCCKECLDKSLSTNRYSLECPICKKKNYYPQKIQRFRLFQTFQNKINQIKNTFDQTHFVNNLIKQAKLKFKYGMFRLAAQVFQSIIGRNPENDYGDFIALGSQEEWIGYYEYNAYNWFQKNYGDRQISVYDLLGLCNLSQSNYQRQKSWYERMMKEHPNNFKLIYGLAVTQHNADKLDEASLIYNNLIEMNPNFSKPYELLGFIYYKKSNMEKSLEYCQKCLSIEPANVYAKYLANRYKICINGDKSLFDPCQQEEYVRPLYQLGYYYLFYSL